MSTRDTTNRPGKVTGSFRIPKIQKNKKLEERRESKQMKEKKCTKSLGRGRLSNNMADGHVKPNNDKVLFCTQRLFKVEANSNVLAL